MGEGISICLRSRCLLERVKGKVKQVYCFLNISTDQEDDSSEKQMELATEKVNLTMQNLDTSTSSLSSQEQSVEKCKDCHFNAHSKYEMKQHRIKSHKKSTAIDTMKKSSRKKFSTKRSCDEYSDSYLDEILNDY